MHVCFIGQEIHPPWIRGDPQLFKEIIHALESTDLDVSLITTYSERGRTNEDFAAFKKELKHVVLTRSTGDHNFSPRSYHFNTLFLTRAALKLAREERIDIFHLGSLNAVLFAPLFKLCESRQSGAQLIRHMYMLQDLSRYTTPIRRASYAYLDAIAATSKSIIEQLCQLHIDQQKLFVIPPIIDTDFFRPMNGLRRTQGTPSLLYLGSVTPKRFPLSVLQGLGSLKKYGLTPKLTIVGRYRFERAWIARIMQCASEMGLQNNITAYIKALNEFEKVTLYNSTDIVLAPFGGFVGATQPPLVLLEAMSCGRIVLATRTQDMERVIEHGYNGLLVDDYNPVHLADTINFGLASGDAEHLGANARKTVVNNFSQEHVTDKILRMYDTVLTRQFAR